MNEGLTGDVFLPNNPVHLVKRTEYFETYPGHRRVARGLAPGVSASQSLDNRSNQAARLGGAQRSLHKHETDVII